MFTKLTLVLGTHVWSRCSDGMILRGSTEPEVGCSEAALAVLMEALGVRVLFASPLLLHLLPGSRVERSLETGFQRPRSRGLRV